MKKVLEPGSSVPFQTISIISALSSRTAPRAVRALTTYPASFGLFSLLANATRKLCPSQVTTLPVRHSVLVPRVPGSFGQEEMASARNAAVDKELAEEEIDVETTATTQITN